MAKKRTRKVYGKLVRDLVPSDIQRRGQRPKVRVLSPDETFEALKFKLHEEAAEVFNADTPAEAFAELADVLEVVYALTRAAGFSWDDLEMARRKKLATKGSFSERFFLEYVDE